METKAVGKYIRISPQKARLVVDLVRGKRLRMRILSWALQTKRPQVSSGRF